MRVPMYIYVYVINIYVYMYIRVCAKHARVHRFNANSAPKEDEEGLSAGGVGWTQQPSHPVLGRGGCRIWPRAGGSFRLSRSSPDRSKGLILAASAPRGRLG